MPKVTSKRNGSPALAKVLPSSGPHVRWGVMGAAEEYSYLQEQEEFQKSTRTDYAKPIDLRIPLGYHAQVRKIWEMYEADRLFRYLVDRCIDFAANGFEWEVPVKVSGDLFSRIARKVKEKLGFKEITQADKEKNVWDTWASSINRDVPNILPGIDEINKWIVKHLFLNGMAPMEWEWETVTIGDEKYQLPVRLIMHNSLAIMLARERQEFLKERAWQRLTPFGPQFITEAISTFDQVDTFAASPPVNGNKKSDQWHELEILNPSILNRKQEAFVLKYNWSPGDNTALIRGKSVNVAQGLYPSPPFIGLFQVYMQRQALLAADLAILDGIINYIIDWEVGDGTTKDENNRLVNHPSAEQKKPDGTIVRKSTMDQVKEMLTSESRGPVTQVFRPYWVKLKIMTPETSSLVNHTKYIQSTLEMFLAFGILMLSTERGMRSIAINTANFEQMLENVRLRHIKRYWEMLANQIVSRNKGKLTQAPNMIFRPLNTQDAAFRTALTQLAKMGKVSTETLLQTHGLDKRTELLRVAKEIANGETELFDQNVPVAFAQTVRRPGESRQMGTDALGRPPKKEPKNPEEQPDNREDVSDDGEDDRATEEP